MYNGREIEDMKNGQQSDKWNLSPQKQISLTLPSFLYCKGKGGGVGEMYLRFSSLMSALQGCPESRYINSNFIVRIYKQKLASLKVHLSSLTFMVAYS